MGMCILILHSVCLALCIRATARVAPTVYRYDALCYSTPFGAGEYWFLTYPGVRFAHPRLSMVGPLRGPMSSGNMLTDD